MKTRNPTRPRPTPFPLLTLMLALAPCAFAQQRGPAACPASLPQFEAALKDAENVTPDKVRKRLTPLVETNDRLDWERVERREGRFVRGAGRILVVMWKTAEAAGFYEGAERKSQTVEPGREAWVVTPRDLRDFYAAEARRWAESKRGALAGCALARRLEQLLGLRPYDQPKDEKVKFVELWVDPADLFRPCPDPEISDQECDTNFPRSRYVMIRSDYLNWFFDLRNRSYLPGGYPWTRLGYTYDWGNPEDHFGLSEFIIPAGTNVRVNCVCATEEYLRRACPCAAVK